MFVSFIAGLVFGVGSGFFEKTIGAPLRKQLDFSDSELSIVSFAALMLLASIIVAALGANSSAFWLVLGGAIGAFAIRGYIFGQAKVEERRVAQKAATTIEDAVSEVTDT